MKIEEYLQLLVSDCLTKIRDDKNISEIQIGDEFYHIGYLLVDIVKNHTLTLFVLDNYLLPNGYLDDFEMTAYTDQSRHNVVYEFDNMYNTSHYVQHTTYVDNPKQYSDWNFVEYGVEYIPNETFFVVDDVKI